MAGYYSYLPAKFLTSCRKHTSYTIHLVWGLKKKVFLNFILCVVDNFFFFWVPWFSFGQYSSPLKNQLHQSLIYIQYIVSISMYDLINSDRWTRGAMATIKTDNFYHGQKVPPASLQSILPFVHSPGPPLISFLSLWISWSIFLELPPARKVHMALWMVKKPGCIEGSLLYGAMGSPEALKIILLQKIVWVGLEPIGQRWLVRPFVSWGFTRKSVPTPQNRCS